MRRTVEGLAVGERAPFVLAVLRDLTGPELRSAWPRLCRGLLDGQPPEVYEKLQFLLPICTILETGDMTKLDPLPPEQRAFAREVLGEFNDPK